MTDILARLDEARAAINVLEHPFYQRWSAGELSARELDFYAGEYKQAVIALADASALAAEKADAPEQAGLRRHAEEERSHVALWEEFERAMATASPAAASSRAASEREPREPLAQTQGCVRAWTAGESMLEHLAVLYAIEAGQPEISRTKLEGLAAHYGYTEEGPATEYFRVHELLDVEHSRQAGALIERLIADEEHAEDLTDRMVRRAIAALQGNWELLDGVEEAR